MAGYLYCMRNTHPTYRRYVKLGYTERFPDERVRELSEKWRCAFELLWDMPVFDPARAEHFLHEHLHSSRVIYEFFNIDPQIAKDLAEQLFDENWRELEDVQVMPESIAELAHQEADGMLLSEPQKQLGIPELGILPNFGPDSDEE